MAKRKELKSIASGLCGSFISRNNDVSGYWGIGRLNLLARQCNVQTVHIDLLMQSMSPTSPQFSKLVTGYSQILQSRLFARRIPANFVVSATIELDFKPELSLIKNVPIATWGAPFGLNVTLVDDRGTNHAVSGYSYCGPHDPLRESRSARGDRF